MRLQRLKLKNVCQHADLDWQLENGLVGVFGPNGSGKSNALNVACYAGITNDYSRHPQGKAGMIRQQAGEEGKSVIEVHFSQDGHNVRVERGLQKPSRHRLFIDGDVELRKANDIQAAIEDTLGISRQLIDRYMFVGQSELYAFLSDTPAVRAKAFAHLCNTTHAEVCWELLGEFIELDRDLAASIVDNTDEIRAAIGELNKKLRVATEQVKRTEDLVLDKEDADRLTEIVDSWKRLQVLQTKLPTLQTQEQEKLEAAKEANKARKQAADDLETQTRVTEKLAEEANEAARRLDSYSASQQTWLRREKQVKRLEEAEEELANIAAPPTPVPGNESEVRTGVSELQVEARQIQKLLDALDNGELAECPTCGTPMAELHDHLEEQRERLDEFLLPRIETGKKLMAQFDRYAKAKSEYDELKKQLQNEVSSAKVALRAFEGVEEPEEIDTAVLNDAVRLYKAAKKALGWNQEQYTENHGKFERAKAEHKAIKARVEECQAEIAELADTVDAESAETAKTELAEHQAAVVEYNRACASVENLEEFIHDRREELKRVQEQLKRSQRARQWLRDLADVRNEVMHRDKLPAVVHRNALLNMEEEINSNLERFDSPYFVATDENLGFTAKFANGTVMPAVGLSGGQKVMLAMSFRLAVNSLFASQVGMMILDEPTDGLDADNRRLAAGVFRTLGQIAKDRGHQIIVITHDEALQSVFDQKFVLEPVV